MFVRYRGVGVDKCLTSYYKEHTKNGNQKLREQESGNLRFASMEPGIFAKLVAVILKGLLPTWHYLSGGFLKS